MITNYKLYHYPLTRSARVRWALYETVGSDIDIEVVQLMKGAQYEQGYLAINPNHHVPLLELAFADGTVKRMIESAAMVEWLVDAFPNKGLAPPAGQSWARADYLSMLHFGASWMDMMLWQIRTHESLLSSEQRDERTVMRYRDKFVSEVQPQLLHRLGTSPYICGNDFSGADIVIGHNVRWAQSYNLCKSDFFNDYLARLAERPAYELAFSDADQFGFKAE